MHEPPLDFQRRHCCACDAIHDRLLALRLQSSEQLKVDNGQLRCPLCGLILIISAGNTHIVNCQLSIVNSPLGALNDHLQDSRWICYLCTSVVDLCAPGVDNSEKIEFFFENLLTISGN